MTKDFWLLESDHRIPAGQPGSAFISSSDIGRAIKEAAVNKVTGRVNELKIDD